MVDIKRIFTNMETSLVNQKESMESEQTSAKKLTTRVTLRGNATYKDFRNTFFSKMPCYYVYKNKMLVSHEQIWWSIEMKTKILENAL